MAIDARYQDNIVLKQDAFQNLLTNIKNYPIVDIDFVTETDEDELHGEPIWNTYTNGVPCIKITYGDERSTKGNVIWNEGLRTQISNKKRQLNELQTVINELTKRKNRWEAIYKQNYAVYQDKDKQVERFKANFDQIEGNKLSFLTAGWNLLYLLELHLIQIQFIILILIYIFLKDILTQILVSLQLLMFMIVMLLVVKI